MDTISKKAIVFSALLPIAACIAVWPVSPSVVSFFFGFFGVVVICVILYAVLMPLFSLPELSCVAAWLILCRFYLPRIYLPSLSLTRSAPLFFLLLIALWMLVKVRRKKPAKMEMPIACATVLAYAGYSLYNLAEKAALTLYYQDTLVNGWSVAVKAIFFAIFTLAAIIVLVFLTWGLRKLQAMNRVRAFFGVCVQYSEIGRSAILIILVLLLGLCMTELLTFTAYATDYALPLLWIGMFAILLAVQVIYIRLLYKTISLKEQMRAQEADRQALALYSRELEGNMSELRGIRHDVKNLFLTMGSFVERSSDEDMKAFYAANIAPFAQQELKKSDLYTSLAAIQDEGLKSFLFYKLIQGINQQIPMELKVRLEHGGSGFFMGQTDLIRVLGILIDNAIEEAHSISGTVHVQVFENITEWGFVVRNSVNRERQVKGIVPGTTDKGLGRGNGLLIANQIIARYKNVVLNSFFAEDMFVQALRIEKV